MKHDCHIVVYRGLEVAKQYRLKLQTIEAERQKIADFRLQKALLFDSSNRVLELRSLKERCLIIREWYIAHQAHHYRKQIYKIEQDKMR